VIDLSAVATQKRFGEIVGISQPAVSDLLMRGVLSDGASLGDWLLDYCRNLREQAAGRAGSGDLDLVEQRARLAAAQAEKVEMANSITRGELTPTVVLEQVLAGAAAKIAGILDAIPGMVRRRVPQLTSGDIDMISVEVAKARNTVASMSLADLKDDGIEEAAVLPAPTFEEVA
jgi:terminase small subunit / prophage DNA-packing protein